MFTDHNIYQYIIAINAKGNKNDEWAEYSKNHPLREVLSLIGPFSGHKCPGPIQFAALPGRGDSVVTLPGSSRLPGG